MSVLTKLQRTIRNTYTLWEFLSILAIFGAALTTSFLVQFAADSPSPWLIFVGSVTCVFFAFTLVIGLRKVILGLVSLVISAGLIVWTISLANDFVQNPAAAKAPSVPQHLWISAVLTGIVAIAAVAVFYTNKRNPLNPVFTWTNNGVSLLGILASALTINFPRSWAAGGQAIGWVILFLTLTTLWPVWKSAAIAASDKARANTAEKAAKDANEAEGEAVRARKVAEARANTAEKAAKDANEAEGEAVRARKVAEARAKEVVLYTKLGVVGVAMLTVAAVVRKDSKNECP